MPIYAYKCDECDHVWEMYRQRIDGFPKSPFKNRCLECGEIAFSRRHHAGEVPATHTGGSFHFQEHFDAGAGRRFGTKAEYTAWQRANTDADGCAPEPLQGRRKVAHYEEALHACHINKQVEVDEKAERVAFGKAWDAAHKDLAACEAMGVKPPSLDD